MPHPPLTALAPFGVSQVQAAAPPVGKQNAGFYRYKVGDIEVTVVTDGGSTSPLADAYVPNAQKDEVNSRARSRLPGKGQGHDRLSHPVVVNTGGKLVAIDTGLGLGAFAQSKGALGQYQSNLKAAGIDATRSTS